MATKKLRVYVENVAVDVFYRRDLDFSCSHQAVVCFPGFPDFIGPTALTNFLVENGKIVFQPHVMGTFDSQGEFCPAGVQRTLALMNRIIWDSTGSRHPDSEEISFPWICDSLIVVGHSFGGVIALRYYSFLHNVSSLIFTSAALHYSEQYGCKENGPEHYENVRKAYPFTYRLAPIKEWYDILNGKDELPHEPIGKVDRILILYGEKDKYFDIDAIRDNIPRLVNSYIASDELSLKILHDVGHPLAEIMQCSIARESINSICSR